jgi:hypothetical protein
MSASPHAVAVNLGTPDRGKITFQWMVSEEQARDFIAELAERLGDPDTEFMSSAEAIDIATREVFAHGVIQR